MLLAELPTDHLAVTCSCALILRCLIGKRLAWTTQYLQHQAKNYKYL